jgi:TRAP transporter TAXI family solute receptor
MKRTVIFGLLMIGILALAPVFGGGQAESKAAPKAETKQAAPAQAAPAAAAQPKAGWPKQLSIGTAPIGGVYYIIGGAWAKILGDKLGVSATVEVTGGPQPNIKLVNSGEQAFGIATNGPVYEAWNGKEDWTKGTKYQNIRAVYPMYASMFHVIVTEKSGIKDVYGLQGQAVGGGAKGGAPDQYGRMIMKALNIVPKQIISMGFNELNSAMDDGQTVGYWTWAGVPQPSLVEMENTRKVVVFGLGEKEIKKVQEDYPYLTEIFIPMGTYKTQKEPIRTISGWNIMIGNKDLAPDFVYEVTRATFENINALIASHPSAKDMPMDRILHSPIPLHPGAIKYYKEKGLKIPDNLIPPEYKP